MTEETLVAGADAARTGEDANTLSSSAPLQGDNPPAPDAPPAATQMDLERLHKELRRLQGVENDLVVERRARLAAERELVDVRRQLNEGQGAAGEIGRLRKELKAITEERDELHARMVRETAEAHAELETAAKSDAELAGGGLVPRAADEQTRTAVDQGLKAADQSGVSTPSQLTSDTEAHGGGDEEHEDSRQGGSRF